MRVHDFSSRYACRRSTPRMRRSDAIAPVSRARADAGFVTMSRSLPRYRLRHILPRRPRPGRMPDSSQCRDLSGGTAYDTFAGAAARDVEEHFLQVGAAITRQQL